MKVTKTINKAENVTAVDFGKLSNLNDYVLELAPEVKIPGKVFDTALVGATGGDFSICTSIALSLCSISICLTFICFQQVCLIDFVFAIYLSISHDFAVIHRLSTTKIMRDSMKNEG